MNTMHKHRRASAGVPSIVVSLAAAALLLVALSGCGSFAPPHPSNSVTTSPPTATPQPTSTSRTYPAAFADALAAQTKAGSCTPAAGSEHDPASPPAAVSPILTALARSGDVAAPAHTWTITDASETLHVACFDTIATTQYQAAAALLHTKGTPATTPLPGAIAITPTDPTINTIILIGQPDTTTTHIVLLAWAAPAP